MTIQKDKYQAYTAALQNDLCTLRDAIERINHYYLMGSILNSDNVLPDDLESAIEAAVSLSRNIKVFCPY